jgi:hypothetical protein
MATCEAYSNKPHRREIDLLAGMTNKRPIGRAPPPGAHLQDFLAGKKTLFFGSDGTFERSVSIIKS